MSEDIDYGRENGWADGRNRRPANPTNGGEVSKDSEYAYMEGYEAGKGSDEL